MDIHEPAPGRNPKTGRRIAMTAPGSRSPESVFSEEVPKTFHPLADEHGEHERESGKSKYIMLANLLRQQILGGQYHAGDKLASENQLSQQYGLSRQTVRQALALLEQEGLLLRQRGSGTYVSFAAPRREKTHVIGVITTYITDYIFPTIVRGIEEELTRNGYHLTLGVTKNRVENEARLLRSFLENRVDGLIVEGTKTAFPNPNLGLYCQLEAMGIPVVFFNGYYRELPSVYVVTNDRKCGWDAAEYLIRHSGCRKLGGIFKSDDTQGHERYAGFSQAILKEGCELDDDAVIWYTTADKETLFSPENAPGIVRRLQGCDGVVCYNDQIAYGLIDSLQKAGIAVPEQVSVFGFDNSSVSEYSPIKISTFAHPKERLGVEAARRLLRMVEQGTKETPLVMDMEPVVKESTR